jgi:hypothetical protein
MLVRQTSPLHVEDMEDRNQWFPLQMYHDHLRFVKFSYLGCSSIMNMIMIIIFTYFNGFLLLCSTQEDTDFETIIISKSSHRLIFPLVKHSIEGEYVCIAENYLGSTVKVFDVVVRDRFRILILSSLMILLTTISLCLIAMILCWRTIKRQKKALRLLTESEIKEFIDGNMDVFRANDYLDTADLIQALPYNAKYEIPKEMIHIGRSHK